MKREKQWTECIILNSEVRMIIMREAKRIAVAVTGDVFLWPLFVADRYEMRKLYLM